MTGFYRTPRTDDELDLCRRVGHRAFIANVRLKPDAPIAGGTADDPRLIIAGPGVTFDMGERGPVPLFGPGDIKRTCIGLVLLAIGVVGLLGVALWPAVTP